MVEGVNGTGRYAPQSKAIAKRSPIAIIDEEIKTFLEGIAPGLEDLGASRETSVMGRMGFRQFDNAGDEVTPMFQRKAFGNKIKDWDTA